MRRQFHLKKISFFTVIALTLSGCVGVSVSTRKPGDQYEQADSGETHREWCGVTLWAVIVPIPLKLPVCKMRSGETFVTPMYACGPLMILGPIVHGYQGNALCGVFPN